MTAELHGMQEAIEALKSLNNKLERKIIRQGLRAGAKVLKSAAQSEAPERTGLLKSSIKVRAGKRTKNSISVNVATSANDFQGKAFYAGFLLYGWRIGKRSLGDARKLQPANNFFKRAFDATGEQAAQTAIDTWKELVQE